MTFQELTDRPSFVEALRLWQSHRQVLRKQSRARRAHLRNLRKLQDLNDHQLRDIGLERRQLSEQERLLRRLF